MLRTILISSILFFFVTSEAQQTNNALDFDGTNDYVQTTYSGVSGRNNRTFEAWIYLSDTPTRNNCITDYGSNFVGSRNTFLVNANLALAYISGGTNTNITSATNVIKVKEWTHVAFVLNSGTGYLYVNGKQEGTGNLSNVNTGTTGTNLRIGERVPGGSIPFEGIIDEVRIWDSARTVTQITDNYNKELCSSEKGLVAYYDFNSGKAAGSNSGVTTLDDNSSSSNNGTLSNFALSGSTSNWVLGSSVTAAPHSDTTWKDTACGSYQMPSGRFVFSGGLIEETIANAVGCDSNITVDLLIRPKNTEYVNVTECDSFRTKKGTLKTNSEIFWETYQNRFECDSLVQTLLTINKASIDTLDIFDCESYTTSKGTKLTTPGYYPEKLVASTGCDSTVVYNFSIIPKTFGSASVAQCFPFTAPSGNVYTSTGTYIDTARNVNGCDSIITYDFKLNEKNSTIKDTTSCDSFRTESGRNLVTKSTSLKEFFKNQYGCDSIVDYDITINFSSTGSDNLTSCRSYILPWGEMVISNGVYEGVIQNKAGCDSTISIGVNIVKLNASFTESENILTATSDYDSYQWLDCDNHLSEIIGEQARSFAPQESGVFALEVEKNNCLDTSDCIPHTSTLSVFSQQIGQVMIYPNPALEKLTIKTVTEVSHFTITDMMGKNIISEPFKSNEIDISELRPGIYYVNLASQEKSMRIKFTKH